jgi:hypothetical protein
MLAHCDYQQGQQMKPLWSATEAISNARDPLDNSVGDEQRVAGSFEQIEYRSA